MRCGLIFSMRKIQYYYNPDTCNYEKVKPSKLRWIRNAVIYLLLALIIAAGALLILHRYYPSPKEARFTAEQQNLEMKWQLLEMEVENLNFLIEALWVHDEEIRVILELDSLPLVIRMAGFGGTRSFKDLLSRRLIFEQKIVSVYQRIEKLKAKLHIQEASLDTLASYANERDNFWACMPAIQPVDNKDLRRLSTVFGMRLHPIYNKWMTHRGLDFMGKTGVPVYATGNGTVKLAQMTYGGFGNLIIIDHGYGYKTRYAHLNLFNVVKGRKVKRGELIGYMGRTGRSAGVHLHYEVLKNGVQVNPIGFFERELGEKEFANLLAKAKQATIPLD